MKHLALLRGINVSGHNMIKMEALKICFEQICYSQIETYAQSGNVFFHTDDENTSKISFDIKQQIFKEFGFDVPVIVISKSDLESCLKNNPYSKNQNVDTKKLYVAFLSKNLLSTAINDLKTSQFKPDDATVYENKIFIKYDIGVGKTRLDQKYIEKKLNLIATIRSWNTVNKLLELY